MDEEDGTEMICPGGKTGTNRESRGVCLGGTQTQRRPAVKPGTYSCTNCHWVDAILDETRRCRPVSADGRDVDVSDNRWAKTGLLVVMGMAPFGIREVASERGIQRVVIMQWNGNRLHGAGSHDV